MAPGKVFDISDEDLDGIEAKGREEEAPYSGFRPIGDPNAPSPVPRAAAVPVEPGSPVLPPPGDGALRRGAARGLLLCAGGLLVGGLVGGPYGAGAGVVGAGAIRNILRAKNDWSNPDPEARAEAAKSATMSIFGLGIAAMLGYHAWQDRYDSA